MKSLAVLFSLFISFGCAGQSINLSFQTIAHGEALRLEKPFTINETDSAQVNQLKFYVSNVQFRLKIGRKNIVEVLNQTYRQ